MSKKYFFKKKQVGLGRNVRPTVTSNVSLSSSSIYSVDDTIQVDVFTTNAVGSNIAVVFDVPNYQVANDESNVAIATIGASGNVTVTRQLVAGSNVNANVDFTVSVRNGNESGGSFTTQNCRFVPIANVTASGGNTSVVDGYNMHTFDNDGSNQTSSSLTYTLHSGTRIAVDALVFAGGGAGGNSSIGPVGYTSGGGGAGGRDRGTTVIDTATSYSVLVGRGGVVKNQAQTSAGNDRGESGYNSQFSSFAEASGGGGGGGYVQGSGAGGGSGGGGRGGTVTPPRVPGTGGSFVSGQGNAGGDGGYTDVAGGGGGAGSAGQDGVDGSTGGAPVYYDWSGANVAYSGGGSGYPSTTYQPGSGTSSIAGGGHAAGSGGPGQIIVRVPQYTRKIVLL